MDTVMCLSVTKWVHLHTGDEGLAALFRKVFDVLAPGGYFILEPQPWKSYRQAVRVKLVRLQAMANVCALKQQELRQLQLSIYTLSGTSQRMMSIKCGCACRELAAQLTYPSTACRCGQKTSPLISQASWDLS